MMLCKLCEGPRMCAERRNRAKHERDDREQRQGALQKQIGKCERIILIQDRDGEGQRRVMAQQLDRPCGLASMQLAQMQGRHGERRQGRGPEGAARPRLSPRHRRQRHDERDERVGQQPHAEGRGDRSARRGLRAGAAPRRRH